MIDPTVPRRSFLARLAAGTAAFGAAMGAAGALPAIARAGEPSESAASPDDLDAWLAAMKAPNKIIYDCVQPPGGSDGVVYARNLLTFSNEKLGTKDADFSIIVSFRHFSSPFGYSDAMWAKYPALGQMTKVEDPETKKPATRNIALHIPGFGLPGATIPALTARGVKYAVCGAATAFIAGELAGKTGDAKKIEAELRANVVPNARVVPAGVVVVQRAQKAGFAYTFAG